MCREVHCFCLGFQIWRVGAAKVDFESKLYKRIFDKGGTSDEIGIGEECGGGVICIDDDIVVY